MALTVIISEEEAHARLLAAIAREGKASAFAKRCGVSPAFLSAIVQRRKNISGKVAEQLGLRCVNAFELTLSVASPEQERYENKRRAELQRNIDAGNLPHYSQDEGIRSISPKNSAR